jgi:cyclopropane-fatty-acyl-phospholipid synthase
MWEFYLAGSEASFRYSGSVVFQIQLTKRKDALPITRDYMIAAPAAMAPASIAAE